MQKILLIIFILPGSVLFGQKGKGLFYSSGQTERLPNVRLSLEKDSSYRLSLFRKSCWLWQFLEGKYFYENDSLVLVYETFHPEPTCQVIDTFHRQRTLKILYVNDKNVVVDKLSLWLDHDTSNITHFPLDYVDTAIAPRGDNSITHTYYAPDFKKRKLKVKFYQPKRKIDKIHFIRFKIDGNTLIPGNQYAHLFEPFKTLLLE